MDMFAPVLGGVGDDRFVEREQEDAKQDLVALRLGRILQRSLDCS